MLPHNHGPYVHISEQWTDEAHAQQACMHVQPSIRYGLNYVVQMRTEVVMARAKKALITSQEMPRNEGKEGNRPLNKRTMDQIDGCGHLIEWMVTTVSISIWYYSLVWCEKIVLYLLPTYYLLFYKFFSIF